MRFQSFSGWVVVVLGAMQCRAGFFLRPAWWMMLAKPSRCRRPLQRIVSLAPHAPEMLFAVGAGGRLVGAVEYSDYPPEAKKRPRVGRSHSSQALDMERIVAPR